MGPGEHSTRKTQAGRSARHGAMRSNSDLSGGHDMLSLRAEKEQRGAHLRLFNLAALQVASLRAALRPRQSG